MIRVKRTPRLAVRTTLAASVVMIGVLSGCSPDSTPASSENADSIIDFTDPVALIAAYAQSLGDMDLDRYAALLASDFVFIPKDEDAADFPWLIPTDPWDRADELGMIGNMMDSTFVSQETGESVDSMEMALTVTNERPVADGLEVTCSAAIQVLWAVGTGARCEMVLVFLLAPDDGGHLRIRRISELPAFLGRGGAAVDPSCWGTIKSLYR